MYLRYFSTLAQVVPTYPQLQCRRAVRCRLPMSRTRRAGVATSRVFSSEDEDDSKMMC